MSPEDVIERDFTFRRIQERLDGPVHRIDVTQHLLGRHITGGDSELSRHFRAKQSSTSDVETFDLGGRYRLRS
ncbi:MAG: hypothetical protein R3E12_09325 [Candidatus Eisenbacteria bacterium]